MNSNNFISLDLEMDQPGEEIIQVGAAVINLDNGLILETDSWYVKLGHSLNPFITKLTGITDWMLENEGVTLHEAYTRMSHLSQKHLCQKSPITWGGGDHRLLRAQLGIKPEEPFAFGRREIDAKTVFQAWRRSQKQPVQGGLARSMTKLGLRFEGRKHNAKDDATQTARIYYTLLQKFTP